MKMTDKTLSELLALLEADHPAWQQLSPIEIIHQDRILFSEIEQRLNHLKERAK
jgi:hypothetical protein